MRAEASDTPSGGRSTTSQAFPIIPRRFSTSFVLSCLSLPRRLMRLRVFGPALCRRPARERTMVPFPFVRNRFITELLVLCLTRPPCRGPWAGGVLWRGRLCSSSMCAESCAPHAARGRALKGAARRGSSTVAGTVGRMEAGTKEVREIREALRCVGAATLNRLRISIEPSRAARVLCASACGLT